MIKYNPIYVICDNIRSLYNVGAIFRTSDAANIEKLYLCGITGYPKEKDPTWTQTAKIAKTALDAHKTVPWEYIKNAKRKVENLKQKGIKIYVLENTLNATCYTDCDYQFPCALVLGHETKGVSEDIIKLADEVIEIPMHGTKTSLNVEAAYAIAVYEILKQKK
jgi:tRNA G18 (ribose-2'-O)-methylase SpoU